MSALGYGYLLLEVKKSLKQFS